MSYASFDQSSKSTAVAFRKRCRDIVVVFVFYHIGRKVLQGGIAHVGGGERRGVTVLQVARGRVENLWKFIYGMKRSPFVFRIGAVYRLLPIDGRVALRDGTIVEIKDIAIGIGIHGVKGLKGELGYGRVPGFEILGFALGQRLGDSAAIIEFGYLYGQIVGLVFLGEYRGYLLYSTIRADC